MKTFETLGELNEFLNNYNYENKSYKSIVLGNDEVIKITIFENQKKIFDEFYTKNSFSNFSKDLKKNNIENDFDLKIKNQETDFLNVGTADLSKEIYISDPGYTDKKDMLKLTIKPGLYQVKIKYLNQHEFGTKPAEMIFYSQEESSDWIPIDTISSCSGQLGFMDNSVKNRILDNHNFYYELICDNTVQHKIKEIESNTIMERHAELVSIMYKASSFLDKIKYSDYYKLKEEFEKNFGVFNFNPENLTHLEIDFEPFKLDNSYWCTTCHGDGSYKVFGKYNNENELVAVKIDMKNFL